MLLIDVATTSVDVGGSASRRAKIARIAELLSQRPGLRKQDVFVSLVEPGSGVVVIGHGELIRRSPTRAASRSAASSREGKRPPGTCHHAALLK